MRWFKRSQYYYLISVNAFSDQRRNIELELTLKQYRENSAARREHGDDILRQILSKYVCFFIIKICVWIFFDSEYKSIMKRLFWTMRLSHVLKMSLRNCGSIVSTAALKTIASQWRASLRALTPASWILPNSARQKRSWGRSLPLSRLSCRRLQLSFQSYWAM